jgi:uncharacterized protein
MVTGHSLYVGQLRHRRFRPRPHSFTYQLFLACLDIDQLDAAMSISPWLSYNRFNWASFDERDHFGSPEHPLRRRVTEAAVEAGVALPDGPMYLLTHLRYLGYCFNPISFYYCFNREHQLHAVLAEVNSTFGERALYWLTGPPDGRGMLRHSAAKTMHVSPFNDGPMNYDFVLTPPGPSLVAHMTTTAPTDAEPFFDATLTLERRPWTRSNLHRALRRHPWMTATVISAIHFEALRLWWKGLRYVPHHAGRGVR